MRMEGHARTWFTPRHKAELWERWKSGQCVADIARALERRNKSGVYRILAVNGGIAPAPRRRAPIALRLEEREEISRGVAAGRSIRLIAQGLRRSPSTVSREIRRNGGCSTYRASEADTRAWQRALRPKPGRLARHAELRWHVAQKLALQWSPEQISGWLKRRYQRGSNENTNGLLRQYFPRGTDLSRFSQAYLNRIALRLNQRPRKTLGFDTPADRLRAVLQ